MEWYQDQISNCTYRQFTTGFFYGKPDHESQIYDSNNVCEGVYVSGDCWGEE